MDFAIRRPDPVGPGAPCRDKLRWAQLMLDERLAAFRRRGAELPAPMVVADSWFSDSKLMQYVHDAHQGTVLVEGKQSYAFTLADGHKVKGHDFIYELVASFSSCRRCSPRCREQATASDESGAMRTMHRTPSQSVAQGCA